MAGRLVLARRARAPLLGRARRPVVARAVPRRLRGPRPDVPTRPGRRPRRVGPGLADPSEDDALDDATGVPGAPPVEVLQIALPPGGHAQQAPDQADLPLSFRQNLDARSVIPPGSQNVRGPHPRGQQPGAAQIIRLARAELTLLLYRR